MQTSEVVLRKQKEKDAILESLELKELGGSVVMEFVKCGKKCTRCNSGPAKHHVMGTSGIIW